MFAKSKKIAIKGSYSAKITTIVETILEIRAEESDVKIVIFSTWDSILIRLAEALQVNDIKYLTKNSGRSFHNSIEMFKDYDQGVTCLLLPLSLGSKGLNLVEATHVFLVEPILDASEEKQAIGRIHRIGQTRPTFVHRFVVSNTIEETIYRTCREWDFKDVTIYDLQKLFELRDENTVGEPMEVDG